MKNDTIEVCSDAEKLIASYQLPTEFEFGKLKAPIMISMEFKNGKWNKPSIIPYQKIELDPCAKVLHYAQEIFEGMKAYKSEEGKLALFRPLENWKRFNLSARRLAMPEISQEDFMLPIQELVKLCAPIIPTKLGYSLYLRPMMIATEGSLGVKPSDDYLYLVIASPSGHYFPGVTSVKVYAESEFCRASRGGMGFAKTGGNYAGALLADKQMRAKGFHQTMWLDGEEKKYIEEMSGMNFFAIIDGVLTTPELCSTILDGITRKSVIDIARFLGVKVVEKRMNIMDLTQAIKAKKCTEAFVCGTAAVMTPVESIFYQNEDFLIEKIEGKPLGPLTQKIKDELLGIQYSYRPDPLGFRLVI